jgi:hypothetical protein
MSRSFCLILALSVTLGACGERGEENAVPIPAEDSSAMTEAPSVQSAGQALVERLRATQERQAAAINAVKNYVSVNEARDSIERSDLDARLFTDRLFQLQLALNKILNALNREDSLESALNEDVFQAHLYFVDMGRVSSLRNGTSRRQSTPQTNALADSLESQARFRLRNTDAELVGVIGPRIGMAGRSRNVVINLQNAASGRYTLESTNLESRERVEIEIPMKVGLFRKTADSTDSPGR